MNRSFDGSVVFPVAGAPAPFAMTRSPKTHLRANLALIASGLAIALGWPGAALGADVSKSVAASPGAVRDYWTSKRMEAAVPADASGLSGAPVTGALAEARAPDPATASFVPAARPGAPPRARMVEGSPVERRLLGIGVDREEVVDPSAPDVRAHGKVFFTIPQGSAAGDYVCSGTAVNSRNRSLVWTAGHCVFDFDAGGGFATNWNFVPGYRDEVAPFGEWPAKELATTPGWRSSANIRYDLGAAVVTKNASGQRLQDVIGARGIGFDQPRDQLYSAFGYPAEPPPLEFTGEREFRCDSKPIASDQPVGSGPSTMAISCDMTGGSSGGGWVVGTTLLSVTSYGYMLEPDYLYGPYLSTEARELYMSVRGKKKKRRHPGTRGDKGGKGDGRGGRGDGRR